MVLGSRLMFDPRQPGFCQMLKRLANMRLDALLK